MYILVQNIIFYVFIVYHNIFEFDIRNGFKFWLIAIVSFFTLFKISKSSNLFSSNWQPFRTQAYQLKKCDSLASRSHHLSLLNVKALRFYVKQSYLHTHYVFGRGRRGRGNFSSEKRENIINYIIFLNVQK